MTPAESAKNSQLGKYQNGAENLALQCGGSEQAPFAAGQNLAAAVGHRFGNRRADGIETGFAENAIDPNGAMTMHVGDSTELGLADLQTEQAAGFVGSGIAKCSPAGARMRAWTAEIEIPIEDIPMDLMGARVEVPEKAGLANFWTIPPLPDVSTAPVAASISMLASSGARCLLRMSALAWSSVPWASSSGRHQRGTRVELRSHT